LFKYIVSFEGQENGAEFLQKPETPAPKPGDVLEGELTSDPKWGLKFKRSKPAYAGGGSSGGYAGKNSPETSAQITRMNALTNAIAYVSKKIEFMEASKVLEYYSAKHVIEVADYFRKFIIGEVTIVTENKPEAKDSTDDMVRWAQEAGLTEEE
jgi:hypothetical protein